MICNERFPATWCVGVTAVSKCVIAASAGLAGKFWNVESLHKNLVCPSAVFCMCFGAHEHGDKVAATRIPTWHVMKPRMFIEPGLASNYLFSARHGERQLKTDIMSVSGYKSG